MNYDCMLRALFVNEMPTNFREKFAQNIFHRNDFNIIFNFELSQILWPKKKTNTKKKLLERVTHFSWNERNARKSNKEFLEVHRFKLIKKKKN